MKILASRQIFVTLLDGEYFIGGWQLPIKQQKVDLPNSKRCT